MDGTRICPPSSHRNLDILPLERVTKNRPASKKMKFDDKFCAIHLENFRNPTFKYLCAMAEYQKRMILPRIPRGANVALPIFMEGEPPVSNAISMVCSRCGNCTTKWGKIASQFQPRESSSRL
jgi:hypothetical protein